MNGYKTYLGIFIAILPNLVSVFGYHLVPGSTDQISTLLNDIITLAGSAFALYGRAVAETPGFLAKNAPNAVSNTPTPPAA